MERRRRFILVEKMMRIRWGRTEGGGGSARITTVDVESVINWASRRGGEQRVYSLLVEVVCVIKGVYRL